MRKLCGLALLALVPAVAVRAADEDKYTTVKGQFIWDAAKGPPPVQAAIKPTKDEEVCAKDKDFKTEDWVVNAKTGGIKNVVVWLAPEPDAATLAAIVAGKKKELPSFDKKDIHPTLVKPAKPTVEIDQPCCRFIPHVLAAQEGQEMIIKNSAAVPHNAKWTSRENGEFNPLIPSGAQFKVPAPLVAERFAINIDCSIHPWMKAYVRVFNHPYFAVTDEDGKFEIKNVPVLAGKLRLLAWTENGFSGGNAGNQGDPIVVKAGDTDLKSIKFKNAK
jgi:hypothetical protein